MTAAERRAALIGKLAGLPPERRAALLRSLGGERADADGQEWPLSPGQERLWFLSRFDPEDASYNTPWCMRLRGPLDAGALAAAFTRVVARHEVLRTRFRLRGDAPVQVVLPPGPVPLEKIAISGEADLDRALREFAERPFDLENEPPLRAGLATPGEDDAVVCIVLHHIVVDGWSLDVLLRELAECYAAAREGREPELPELPTQYPRFAVQERQRDHTEGLRFWASRLAGAPTLDLPADRPRPLRWSGRGARVELLLPPEDVTPLERVARRRRCTSFMALAAAYEVTLGLASGQRDFCVGVPVAGRPRSELAPLIGYFGNTLVLRADLSGDPSFHELLDRVREAALAGMRHADVPFEHILAALRVPRDIGRPPLCQTMFNLHNLPNDDLLGTRFGDLDREIHVVPPSHTKAEISIDLWRGPEGLGGVLDYSSDLFAPATANRLVRGFAEVVRRAGADPDVRLSALSGVF
ncbi:condensation domain-containing protein [Microbispora sp. H11081]|uniref:condensation domain-containing protein n=1 Tax=Microbispora sp. H11081 TaxID=2729107 RepID=UPI001474ED1F|nr:condensation domain-containing protein [Microbispora sp. H11081]